VSESRILRLPNPGVHLLFWQLESAPRISSNGINQFIPTVYSINSTLPASTASTPYSHTIHLAARIASKFLLGRPPSSSPGP
jgi:hypothetical protein